MTIPAWYVLSAPNRRWIGVLMMSKTMMSAARNAMSAPISGFRKSEAPESWRCGGVQRIQCKECLGHERHEECACEDRKDM